MKKKNKKTWDFIHISRIGYNEENYFNHHRGKYDIVKRFIKNSNAERILDIGVASGIFYSLLQDFNKYSVSGIDVVPEYMPVLKERGIEGRLCNIEKECIPYPDESFDLVLCDSIFEHTLKPKHLANEIYRVLKSKGNFIVVVPNATSAIRRWNHLRGRNIFEPLIDNLYSRDYLSRCAIFYAESELKFVLENSQLVIDKFLYINETSRDANKLAIKILRVMSSFIPKLRDVIILTGHKNS